MKDEQIDSAWRWICKKRDSRNSTLRNLEEVSSYFLEISTSESNAGKRNKKKGSMTDQDDDWDTENKSESKCFEDTNTTETDMVQ